MGRLKKDHSGWSTHGKWLKYQEPKIEEKPVKGKSKKNTRKWCRGKVGVEHELRRYFQRYGVGNKTIKFMRAKCENCGKQFHHRSSDIPLVIDLDSYDGRLEPVQVKVNGRAVPIDYRKFHDNYWWCEYCGEWH